MNVEERVAVACFGVRRAPGSKLQTPGLGLQAPGSCQREALDELQWSDRRPNLHALFVCLAVLVLAVVGPRLVLAQAANEPAEHRPNVLFLISDDQRPDTIAALGTPIIDTPNLDLLVRRGTTFTRACCAHPLCVPSRAEILTGCTGFRNGVHPPHNQPDMSLVTWPQAMRQAGYQTWWVGKWHLAGRPSTRGYEETLGLFAGGGRLDRTQLDFRGREVTGYRGWVFQSDDRRLFPDQGIGLTPDISARFADAAVEFLQRPTEQPFLLQVNFTAPHDPLLLPPGFEQKYDAEKMPLPPNFLPRHPFDHGNLGGRDELLLPLPRSPADVRHELAAYYAVISHMDEQIGRILAALSENGLAENTVVIFASDHGLAMGSHGLRGKQNMYEHTINVPLIFAGPGIPAGVRLDAQCYLRDLFPTVCELAEVPIPESVQGRSLVPVIRGERKTLYDFVVGYFQDAQRMIRTERWKLIWYPKIDHYQLFDLGHDPHELENLADQPQHGATKAQLRAQLDKWLKRAGDPLLSVR